MPRDTLSGDINETDLETARFMTWLVQSCGYISPRLLTDDRYACVMPLLFTHAIIVGRIGDVTGYSDRWCYGSKETALAALEAWEGEGEPEGWHRHPMTGRRRDPDTGETWINP